MATLVQLPESPWSEKARWSLDHHGIPYRAVQHLPMIYEPFLRVLSRTPRQKPTVPMLFDRGQVFRDSLSIALHTDAVGSGTPLFPKEHDAEIFTWNDAAERMARAARGRLMERLLASPPALVEAIPPPLSALGSALLPVAKMAAGFVASKYDTTSQPSAGAEAAIAHVLERVESTLDGKTYLVGDRFTFADLAVAATVGFISPHARQPLGPASREVWSEPKFAQAFSSVIAWRDRIFELHR